MKTVFLLLSLLISVPALCQTDTIYLNSRFKELFSPAEAAYYRVISYSGSGKEERLQVTYHMTGEKYYEEKSVKTEGDTYKATGPAYYYYKSGKVKQETVYTGQVARISKFHESGQLYYRYAEMNGLKEGEAIGYFPSGKTRRHEQWVNGKLKLGKCFNEDGTETKYYPHMTFPNFKGGTQAFTRYIQINFKLPKEVIRNKMSGVVVVRFDVDKTGKVGEADIIKHVLPSIDLEALRLVKNLPNLVPGTEEGEPVDQMYTIPLNITAANR
ncbi:MAG: energy transducer TonB [Rufibacter sp.]